MCVCVVCNDKEPRLARETFFLTVLPKNDHVTMRLVEVRQAGGTHIDKPEEKSRTWHKSLKHSTSDMGKLRPGGHMRPINLFNPACQTRRKFYSQKVITELYLLHVFSVFDVI